jgi:hypothetical protein
MRQCRSPPPARHKVTNEIDPGIRQAVRRLQEAAIETFESCEGGQGHAYPQPTVAFLGGPDAGWHALSARLAHRLPVRSLRRVRDVLEPNEPIGPHDLGLFTFVTERFVPVIVIDSMYRQDFLAVRTILVVVMHIAVRVIDAVRVVFAYGERHWDISYRKDGRFV